ncbi:unnamed protein product [Rhodiola kirilowii]
MSISAPFSSHRKFLNFHQHHGFTNIRIRLPPAATTISPQPFNPKLHLSTHSHIAYLPPPARLSTSDSYNSPLPGDDDANAKDETLKKKSFSTKEAFMKLKRYGSCGILAYGLLNTAYYIATFLVVWFYVAPSPGKMGYFAAVQRFVKVMAMVWAGSQVTKIARAAGALALAPFVEKALSWSSEKFKFRSQARAYMMIVGICVGMALVLFLAELVDNLQSVSLWSHMPYDIGHIILEKLNEVVEHIRFGAVCKQWYMISKENKEMCKSSPKRGIDLPALRDWSDPEWCFAINKLIISPDSTPDDYTVVAIYAGMDELATIKSGEKYWVYIPPRPETLPASLFSDIVFYQGAVYAVSTICMVVKVDVRARPPILKVVHPLNRKTSFRKTYLVESTSSDLYLLQRCFEKYSPGKESLTNGFNVLILKLHGEKGVLIDQNDTKSLDGDTFFVGDNTSIAIRANDGCMTNSIYFTDDLHDAGYFKASGPTDIGYYNVEDDTIRRFYKSNPAHKKGVHRPIWIMPHQCTTFS